MPTDKNTLDKKHNPVRTISPEMQERRRIMSRMTSEEKKEYKWKCYDEKAKLQLLELVEYCQDNDRVCPMPLKWNRAVDGYMRYTSQHKFTKFPPFKFPLILSVWHYASDADKRLRLLTQIYWCYKNTFINRIYEDIMELSDDDWVKGYYQEDKISLELIKKEYSTWLGVNYHPEHNIWNHCTDHDKKRKQIERAEEIYDNQEDILDDESTTSIEPSYRTPKWPKVEEAWEFFFSDVEYKEKHRALDDARHEALIAYELFKLGYFNG